eukprot:CAMPEP_0206607904 /NCGR_PEP_ID=MMETSP0325_2-20121206/52555_1 /ASSEMBLY_ACC=CAM_ASM_000347 /TAXON_ID=2866 /ORGANISM="Crypthecodinium cohnii, Strain Seligo" /LENGTH=681 /DNA_ID=CAMNT_0054125261 /DNA_START=8 /DNA_END=2053 /DNA_ORIENTATION=-
MTTLRSVFLQKSQGRPGQCYEPVQKLGEGAFGVAHLVRDKRQGFLRVLKTINKRQSQVPAGQLEKEIRNLKACDHPHIVRLFEYYEDYENIYLIMEHAQGGELHQVLEAEKRKGFNLPERWVAVVIKQCLAAVAHVHSQGIIHKDLKSENILLLHKVDPQDSQTLPHAVIIDLGIADVFSARLGRRARCTVVAGTPTHMAPEVWRGNFGPVADVWSLGVVMFELLAGEMPFMCSSLNSASEWLRLHRQGPNWSLLSHVSKQARAILQRMLNWDERMRPTAQQCLGHSWFKETSVDVGIPLLEEPTSPTDDADVEDEKRADSLQPPLTSRQPPTEVVLALGDYIGRSRFEKGVLMQVASQCHLGQMTRISEVFSTADHNDDGHVSREELKNCLIKLGVEAEEAESYVAAVDVDNNGRVEYTELASGCVGLLYESLRSLLWQSFCTFDVDGNGVLSRDEIMSVVTRQELAQHGFPRQDNLESVQEALERLDLDGNGQVSFDELCWVLIPRPQFGSNQEVAGPLSGRGAGNSARQGRAMQDEEFAQLLDQIEADHGSFVREPPPAAIGDVSPASPPAPPPPSSAQSLAQGLSPTGTTSASPRHRFGVAHTADGAEVPGIVGLPQLQLGGYAGVAEVPDEEHFQESVDLSAELANAGMQYASPEVKNHMTVDEELSNLLKDIAQG